MMHLSTCALLRLNAKRNNDRGNVVKAELLLLMLVAEEVRLANTAMATEVVEKLHPIGRSDFSAALD